MLWLQLIFYASLLLAAILFIVKVVKYVTMPVHLRWELYPVPHERGCKYGGSYLEESDWWAKFHKKSRVRDFVYLAQETFFCKEYYRRNRQFWYVLYPFYIGMFLFFGWLFLLLLGALLMVSDVAVAAESASLWGRLIYSLTLGVGIAAFVVGGIGCIAMGLKTFINEDLRLFAAPVDYFYLLLVLAIYVSGLIALFFFDPTFAIAREFVRSLITFSPVVNMNPATATQIIVFSLFIILFPLSKMMYFFTKYFAHYMVHWDDKPNLKGSDIERRVKKLLNQPISWSAPHIQSGLKWSEVVVGLPEDTTGVETK